MDYFASLNLQLHWQANFIAQIKGFINFIIQKGYFINSIIYQTSYFNSLKDLSFIKLVNFSQKDYLFNFADQMGYLAIELNYSKKKVNSL